MLALMYWCGLRVDEVGGLAVEDVVWVEEREAWELVVRRAKSSWEDVVLPIEDATGKLLSSYKLGVREGLPGDVALFPSLRPGRKKDRGRGLKPDAVRKIFEARRKAAGIRLRGRVLTPHCLRHTLATELVNTPGWELDDVQAHMRHASMDTTRGYVHRSENRRTLTVAGIWAGVKDNHAKSRIEAGKDPPEPRSYPRGPRTDEPASRPL
jgi:integrase